MIVIKDKESFIHNFPYDKKDGLVFFDTETTGLDVFNSKLLLSSYMVDSVIYVVDMLSVRGVESEIKDFLESNKVIVHNAVFDWKVMYHHCNIFMRDMHCTLVTEQLLKSGIHGYNFGLDDILFNRYGIAVDKSVRETFYDFSGESFTEDQYMYSGRDVAYLEKLYFSQMEEIKQNSMEDVYNLECSLLHITSRMEYNGICLDAKKIIDAVPVVEKVVHETGIKLQDVFIQEGIADNIVFSRNKYTTVNVGSPVQMLRALNNVGIDVGSTGSKVLAEWDSNYSKNNSNIEYSDDYDVGFSHPVLRARAIYITASKFLNSYYKVLPTRVNSYTGRVHGSFNQCGAASTGRYSSDLQQIPNRSKLEAINLGDHDIRSCFVAPPGRKFIIADYSGQEMGVLALYSQDKALVDQMLRGDIHSHVAMNLFGVDPSVWDKKVEPYKTMRTIAKRFNFALIYGGSAFNFFKTFYNDMQHIGIKTSVSYWEDRISMWTTELFPNVGDFLEKNGNSAAQNFYTRSISGRKRNWSEEIRFDKWKTFAAIREGKNHPIQASSADITKKAMILIDSDVRIRGNIRLVLCIHDELVYEIDADVAEEALPFIKEQMEYAVTLWFPHAEAEVLP